jgi:hypothetical protein
MFDLLAIVSILNHGTNEAMPNFCYKYLFSDRLLASKVTFVVQQPINSCIVNSSNFVPSTSNVIMYKDHESIVLVLENKKGIHICKNTIC